MSLIGHWKLDGNANDSSGNGNDGIVHGTLSYIDGIINQALTLDGTANTGIELLQGDKATQYQNNFSIATWFKSNSIAGDGGARILSRDASDYWCWLLYQNQSFPQDFRFYYSDTQSVLISDAITGDWQHIVSTWELSKNAVKLFIDGEEKFSTTNFDTFTTTTRPIVVGGNTEGDGDISGNEVIGDFDDIRAYDNILSLKEIKEISKAQVLWYSFDSFAESTENLINDPLDSSKWSHHDDPDYGFVSHEHNVPLLGTTGYRRTCSGTDYRGNLFRLYWDTPTDMSKSYATSIYVRCLEANSNTRIKLNYQGSDSSGNRVDIGKNVDISEKKWYRADLIDIPADHNFDSMTSLMKFYFRGDSEDRTWEVVMPQTEVKDHITPFVNGTRIDTILDDSGNGHETELDDIDYTPEWTSDSIIGSGCYHFDGSGTTDGTIPGDYISVDESITRTDNYPQGCTYSFWVNADTDAVDRMSLLYGGATKNHIEIYSDSKKFRTEAARQNQYSFGTGNFPDDVRGVWSHFAIVFANDETNRPVRWYQNGQLFHTGDLSSGDFPDTKYFSFNKIARSTGDTSYNYAKSFDGKVDDFRIFATTLTENQIQNLVHQRASIDDKGNLWVRDLIEDIPVWKQVGGPLISSMGSNISDRDLFQIPDSHNKSIIPYEQSKEFSSAIDGKNYTDALSIKGATWYKTIKAWDSNEEPTVVSGYGYSTPIVIRFEFGPNVCMGDVKDYFFSYSDNHRQLDDVIKVYVNNESIGQTDIVISQFDGDTFREGNLGLANSNDTFDQPSDNYLSNGIGRHIFSYNSTSTGQNAVRCQPRCWSGDEDAVVEVVWSYSKNSANPISISNNGIFTSSIIPYERDYNIIPAFSPSSIEGEPFKKYKYYSEEAILPYYIYQETGGTSHWYRYDFEVIDGGDYIIEGFIHAWSGSNDSFYMSVDNEAWDDWHTGSWSTGEFRWVEWDTRNLSEGSHNLRIAAREATEMMAIRIQKNNINVIYDGNNGVKMEGNYIFVNELIEY
jgi:hypothetical protein